jgi:hypothetical protein
VPGSNTNSDSQAAKARLVPRLGTVRTEGANCTDVVPLTVDATDKSWVTVREVVDCPDVPGLSTNSDSQATMVGLVLVPGTECADCTDVVPLTVDATDGSWVTVREVVDCPDVPGLSTNSDSQAAKARLVLVPGTECADCTACKSIGMRRMAAHSSF